MFVSKFSYPISILTLSIACTFQTPSYAEPVTPIGRIVKGDFVSKNQYPWMAGLLFVERDENNQEQSQQGCGGALISPTWVVTAAHCLDGVEATGLKVLLNAVDTQKTGEGEEIISAKRFVVHPTWLANQNRDDGTPDQGTNEDGTPVVPQPEPAADIALIELDTAAVTTPISVLAAESRHIPYGTTATVIGWGMLDEGVIGFLEYFTNVYFDRSKLAEDATEEDAYKLLVQALKEASYTEKQITRMALLGNQVAHIEKANPTAGEPEKGEGFLQLVKLANEKGGSFTAESSRFDEVYDYLANASTPIETMLIQLGQVPNNLLRHTTHPVADLQACKKFDDSVQDYEICAGEIGDEKGSCYGDSGGPFIIHHPEQHTPLLAGAVSRGTVTCGLPYNIYTNVAAFIPFIKESVTDFNTTTVNYPEVATVQCDTNTPIPNKPELKTFSHFDRVLAEWSTANNAQGYRLFYAPYSNPIDNTTLDNISTVEMSTSRATAAQLPAESKMYVAVQAYNCNGSSEYSNLGAFMIPKEIDNAPTGTPMPQGEAVTVSQRAQVFGIPLYAPQSVPKEKLQHVAHVLAEYIDNDEDGTADDPDMLKKMQEGKAAMLVLNNEQDFIDDEKFFQDKWVQGIYSPEIHPTGSKAGAFDATLEEVLHLITDTGYVPTYPNAFGFNDSELTRAMDTARGGKFATIPAKYPENAWYTYTDQTCTYECQMTEYFYWALTSILEAQSHEGRLAEINDEWKLNTVEKVQQGDPAVYTLLTNKNYRLPTRLPDGQYTAQAIEIK